MGTTEKEDYNAILQAENRQKADWTLMRAPALDNSCKNT